MNDKQGTFSEWFEAQHGKRPGGDMPSHEVLNKLKAAQYEVSRLQALYNAQAVYDAQLKSAQSAWYAQEGK